MGENQSSEQRTGYIHLELPSDMLGEACGMLDIAGWALAIVPIQRIVVRANGEVIGTASYGLHRPDIAENFPQIPGASNSGFHFTCDTKKLANGAAHFELLAEAAGVALATKTFQCSIANEPDAPIVEEIRLHCDSPDPSGDKPITAETLVVNGWALAGEEITAVEVRLDGKASNSVSRDLRRPDLKAAFPEHPMAERAGFACLLRLDQVPPGAHELRIDVRTASGETAFLAFPIQVEQPFGEEATRPLWQKLSEHQRRHYGEQVARLLDPPTVTLITRVSGPRDLERFAATLESLEGQIYPHWRLLVRASSEHLPASPVHDRVDAIIDEDIGRSRVAGELVGFLKSGDQLAEDALMSLALAFDVAPDLRLVYADHSVMEATAERPVFKPGWSPDLLLAQNYIGRTWLARADALQWDADWPPCGADETAESDYHYATLLRLTRDARGVTHIPQVLCRVVPDDPTGPQHEAATASIIAAELETRGTRAVVQAQGAGRFLVRRPLTDHPRVSIIIPTCGKGQQIEICLTSLIQKSTYPNYEIIVVENMPEPIRASMTSALTERGVRVVRAPERFNWSLFNNLAAQVATGEHLLFLNDDVEVVSPDWIEALVENAQRPDVGAVGAKLLYPNGQVQHCGMFLTRTVGQARHAFRFLEGNDPGPLGLAASQHNCTAVTGACLMVRRDLFDQLGGFDERFDVVNNDLDFCLRAHEAGLRNVVVPHAVLVHHECLSRSHLDDSYDTAAFRERWATLFGWGDPYINPNLSQDADLLQTDHQPARETVAGAQLFDASAVHRILVVKLDHLGDLLLAFPAIRCLKSLFPKAHLTALVGSWARDLTALEPAIDEVLTFDFFNKRSGDAKPGPSAAELQALGATLRAKRFDLAVDLRRHSETRPVLRVAGARWTAGFRHGLDEAWLDVQLPAPPDISLATKTTHMAEDLMRLAVAVGAAAHPASPLRLLERPEAAERPARRFGDRGAHRPVVCIHPAAGSAIKQWPAESFAALADRLVAEFSADILVVGSPEDGPIAEAVVSAMRHRDGVRSLVGKLALSELPGVLTGCSLFIGNDSGPKHLAAALGVPTLGIHSGNVDVAEWAPVGPHAVAVHRAMRCSPCFFGQPEDCPANVDCLRGLPASSVYRTAARLLLAHL